ncbi:unnamed protein product [Pseudo-nitzschia multistriata]|uniref:Sulfite exporter TauE/SafE n=1 Tax=Pseudo-nitzschia multistriata TaxID=183589 RepID=A0A448ZF12_9STRA|nr:unnamed protein product [Pseudo-nitzschia multistriata]
MSRVGRGVPTIFLPALCVYPIWLTIGIREDALVSAVVNYYPMMVAMVLGSMIAGSTPLGGGVVAFPVSVLVLGFSPDQGRDFSLLIQSVGMTAASFLIFYKKRCLLSGCEDAMVIFSILSVIGMIVGFECFSGLSPYVVNIMYTTTVACIALVLAYFDVVARRRKAVVNDRSAGGNDAGKTHQRSMTKVSDDISDSDIESEIIREGPHVDSSCVPLETTISNVSDSAGSDRRWMATTFTMYICLPVFATAGGILSSQIGSGADIAFYFYGCVYNATQSRHGYSRSGNTEGKIGGNTLTAGSVIIMANTSIFGSILRVTTQKDSQAIVDDRVYQALMACIPIVVLGAPVGSLFLTQSNQQRLKYLFYVLGILQLAVFGIIKIGNDYLTWSAILGLLSFVMICLVTHHTLSSRYGEKGSVTFES